MHLNYVSEAEGFSERDCLRVPSSCRERLHASQNSTIKGMFTFKYSELCICKTSIRKDFKIEILVVEQQLVF